MARNKERRDTKRKSNFFFFILSLIPLPEISFLPVSLIHYFLASSCFRLDFIHTVCLTSCTVSAPGGPPLDVRAEAIDAHSARISWKVCLSCHSFTSVVTCNSRLHTSLGLLVIHCDPFLKQKQRLLWLDSPLNSHVFDLLDSQRSFSESRVKNWEQEESIEREVVESCLKWHLKQNLSPLVTSLTSLFSSLSFRFPLIQAPEQSSWNGLLKGYYVGYKVSGTPDQYLYKTIEGEGVNVRVASSPDSSSEGVQVAKNQGKQHHQSYIVVLTALKPHTEYAILVQAFNSMGAGPQTDPVIITTHEDGITKYIKSSFYCHLSLLHTMHYLHLCFFSLLYLFSSFTRTSIPSMSAYFIRRDECVLGSSSCLIDQWSPQRI